MVSAAEIDALYESTLKPRLEALEGLRHAVKAHIRQAVLLVGVPVVLLWADDLVALALPDGLGWLATVVPLLALLAGLIIAGVRHVVPGFAAFSNYRVRFKHEVAAEVFRIVCPTAVYSPLDGIAEAIFDQAGLFNLRGDFKSDDLVRGTIGQTPFEAADVSRSYTTGNKHKRHGRRLPRAVLPSRFQQGARRCHPGRSPPRGVVVGRRPFATRRRGARAPGFRGRVPRPRE